MKPKTLKRCWETWTKIVKLQSWESWKPLVQRVIIQYAVFRTDLMYNGQRSSYTLKPCVIKLEFAYTEGYAISHLQLIFSVGPHTHDEDCWINLVLDAVQLKHHHQACFCIEVGTSMSALQYNRKQLLNQGVPW